MASRTCRSWGPVRLAIASLAVLLCATLKAVALDPVYIEFKQQFMAKRHEMTDEERAAAMRDWEVRLEARMREWAAAGDKEEEARFATSLLLIYSLSGRFEEARAFLREIVESDLPPEEKAFAAMAAASRCAEAGASREDYVALIALRQQALAEVVEGIHSGALSMSEIRQGTMEGEFAKKHHDIAGFDFHSGNYLQAVEELKRHYAAIGEMPLTDVMKKELRKSRADRYHTLLDIAGCYLSIAEDALVNQCEGESRIGSVAETEEGRRAFEAADEWLARAIREYPNQTCEINFAVKRSTINQCRYIAAPAERLHIARRLGVPAEDYLTRVRSTLAEERPKYQGQDRQNVLSEIQSEISTAHVFYVNRKCLPAEPGFGLLEIESDLACELHPDNCAESKDFQKTALDALSFAISLGDETKAKEFLDLAASLPLEQGAFNRKLFDSLQEKYLRKFAEPLDSAPLLAELNAAGASFGKELANIETPEREPTGAQAFAQRHRISILLFAVGIACLVGAGLFHFRPR